MTVVQSEQKPPAQTDEVEAASGGGVIPAPERDTSKGISTIKGPAGRKSVGSISSLDDLLANAEKIENERKTMNTVFDLPTINKIWNGYMEDVEANSTKNALGSAKISLKGDTDITIVTPNKINTETIKKEMNLIRKIRDSYPDRILVFKIYDDLNEFPELTKVQPVQKEKTNQQKLEILVEKNPKVADFIERFNLKVDK